MVNWNEEDSALLRSKSSSKRAATDNHSYSVVFSLSFSAHGPRRYFLIFSTEFFHVPNCGSVNLVDLRSAILFHGYAVKYGKLRREWVPNFLSSTVIVEKKTEAGNICSSNYSANHSRICFSSRRILVMHLQNLRVDHIKKGSETSEMHFNLQVAENRSF